MYIYIYIYIHLSVSACVCWWIYCYYNSYLGMIYYIYHQIFFSF